MAETCDQLFGVQRGAEGAREAVGQVRWSSQNPCLAIVIGGPVFIEHAEFVAEVGADAMAAGGRLAVMRASSLPAPAPQRV